ncbi:hypothetical protein [Roseovarius dicentrarchi]|uniref:hypothetical protein n=1 Tax=Roseovarius dicentrarchi TaxID=2250573 RepID=UPI000DE9860D|nr:hypothetical protein [Roseovarius dicentrarchi]
MQRVKHADRKLQTRVKIVIGEAVVRAGASHLPVEEIEAVLANYVQTGGTDALRAFVKDHARPANGGSAATPRDDVEVESLDQSEGTQQ